ncbi:MAG: hypothetical protein QM740_04520 [Acidovorax sp.]
MRFPISALGQLTHDDQLFVRLAADIGAGHWLGAYNNLTHAKGIGYSLFLAFNHLTGLPLKFSEQLLYLVAAGLFAVSAGQLVRSRAAVLATFSLLAFLPSAWDAGIGGRVLREGVYVSQVLLLVALGIRCWLLPPEQPRRLWWQGAVLGLVGGWFWLTREEGVWLLPTLGVLMLYGVWGLHRAQWPWRRIAAVMATPLLAATLVVGTVNTVNYAVYGVFRNNDFRSPDFLAGYGALTRLRHDHWQQFILFPRDARERAYAMSAAARELRPYLDGAGGDMWRQLGCQAVGASPCPEILSAWFMWALRDAVASAGHYDTALSARSFYRRLASEINAGCRQHPDDCLPARATLLPPWKDSYVQGVEQTSRRVFHTLATLGNIAPGVAPSQGPASELALVKSITNGPLAPSEANPAWDAALRNRVRMALARHLTTAERAISSIGLPLALAAWALWSVAVLLRRRVPPAIWVAATALAAAVASRVVLLGLLDATSMPADNMQYLLPVAPLSLALLPVVFWGMVRWFQSQKKQCNSPS